MFNVTIIIIIIISITLKKLIKNVHPCLKINNYCHDLKYFIKSIIKLDGKGREREGGRTECKV